MSELAVIPSNCQDPVAAESKRLEPRSKRAAVLRALLERGERGLNCFEAVRLCHDYVLRTTVSDIDRQYGLRFSRKWEQVPGFAGSKVDCVRYWLSPEAVARAREILGPDGLKAAA